MLLIKNHLIYLTRYSLNGIKELINFVIDLGGALW